MQTNIKATSPYSHGFEKTYGFETVDIKSVKPLSRLAKISSPSPTSCSSYEFNDGLLEFAPPLGRGCFSLSLSEPPSVLQLSPLAKKALSPLKIATLKQLYQELPLLKEIKGLGLGHIQEISEKTTAYLGPHPFKPKATLDAGSLIRIALDEANPKERYLILSKLGLDHYCTISQQELQELAKISEERKQESHNSYLTFLKTSRKDILIHLLQNISSAFIIPFIDQRLALVEKWEIDECLSKHLIVNRAGDLSKILNFIQIILDTTSVYESILYKVSSQLYTSRQRVLEDTSQILSTANSYFYGKLASFNLYTLSAAIRKTHALQWKGYPDGFIEKVLLHSGHFFSRRDENGAIELTLAIPKPMHI